MSRVLYVAVDKDCPEREGRVYYAGETVSAVLDNNYTLAQYRRLMMEVNKDVSA